MLICSLRKGQPERMEALNIYSMKRMKRIAAAVLVLAITVGLVPGALAAPVTVTWPETATKVYDGEEWSPVPAVTDDAGNPLPADAYTVSYSGDRTNCSGAPFTATVSLAATDYTMDAAAAAKEFTITPAVLDVISWPDSVSVTYSGTAPAAPTGTVSGAPGDYDAVWAWVPEDSGYSLPDAGEYCAQVTITVRDGKKQNYDSAYKILMDTGTVLTITREEAGPDWCDTEVAYNCEEQIPAAADPVPGDRQITVSAGGLQAGATTALNIWLDDLEKKIGEEAGALREEICARIAGLAPEELEALSNAYAEYFPRGAAAEEDGEWEAFSLTLEFTRGESVTWRRYTFRFRDGGWELHSVEESN